MGGVFARVLYAMLLAGVLAIAAWLSFSHFVAGRSLKVPDFTRLQPDEAAARAAERGLRVAVDTSQNTFDEKVPAHRIRGQSPAPGTAVKEGQTVRLFLSLGPRTIRVPDLTGQSARTAALALARSGLKDGDLSVVRLSGLPGIVAQGMAPGSVAPPDAAVDLLVNRGPYDVTWVMPDLIGRDFDRIRIALEARGFRIGGVRSQVYEGAAAGTILRQFPLAGYPVSLKDTLSFVVAAPEAGP